MFIATLFQIGDYGSANDIFTALFIFLVLASIHGFALSFRILATHDGNDWLFKQNLRPLIPLVILIIRYFAL